MEEYSIPFFQKSYLKLSMILLLLVLSAALAASSIFFFAIVMKDEFIVGLFFGLFMLIVSFFFAYMLLFIGILKRLYVEMTLEYIKISFLFKTKVVYWREIQEVQAYEAGNNIIVGILLKKDKDEKRRRSISNNFSSLLGVPPYSFQIPIRFFKDIDIGRFLLTMDNQINKANLTVEVNFESHEEYENSIIKAIITSSFFCILTSVIYGFTIYKLEANYVVIPMFACLLIVSGFNKYYLEKSFNLNIRFLLGLICSIQFPIAIIAAIIMPSIFDNLEYEIMSEIAGYFEYLVHYPLEQIAGIIVTIICFLIGFFKGRTNNEKV